MKLGSVELERLLLVRPKEACPLALVSLECRPKLLERLLGAFTARGRKPIPLDPVLNGEGERGELRDLTSSTSCNTLGRLTQRKASVDDSSLESLDERFGVR